MGDTARLGAGTMAHLRQPAGEWIFWIFVDMGFANRAKSCGYLAVTAEHPAADVQAEALTFGALKLRLRERVQATGDGPLHLVLEAPLSTAFDASGNPVGRIREKQDGKTRYWYVGLGCSVLVASLYLLKYLDEAPVRRETRLFEGFVSFKSGNAPTDHRADVKALCSVVRDEPRARGGFYTPEPLEPGGVIESILSVFGREPTPPPIIQALAG